MTMYDVVKKLIGEVMPVGETQEDDKRFANLKVLIELVNGLIGDIDDVASEKSRYEYSRKRAGEFADKALTNLGIQE